MLIRKTINRTLSLTFFLPYPFTSILIALLTLTNPNLKNLESYVRGSGPGGQKVNKTSNKVVLRHIPTNIIVQCQETRSLSDNRRIARKILAEKVDVFVNGGSSRTVLKEGIAIKKKKKGEDKKRRNREKKLRLKIEKENEVNDKVGDGLE